MVNSLVEFGLWDVEKKVQKGGVAKTDNPMYPPLCPLSLFLHYINYTHEFYYTNSLVLYGCI